MRKLFLPTIILAATGVLVAGFITAKGGTATHATDDSLRAPMISYRVFPLQPDANVKVMENNVKAGLLYDVENKKIVWQKGMNNVFPIASLTKMMVGLLAVEDVRAGKIHWDDKVEWTREVIMQIHGKNVKSYAPVSYTLNDLFKNAMIASNNEAAEQIARYLGHGDLDASIQRMNFRARELGMNSTYYGNPTGLPSRSLLYDNSSCPADLLILALEMLKYDEVIQVTRMDYADISNGKSTTVIRNHNHLTIDFQGQVDGMKTGYTKRAGFCLVASSYKCDHRLISVVLGSRAPMVRNEVVKDMFNDYYTSIGLDKLSPYCTMPEQFTTAGANNSDDADAPEGEYTYQTKTAFVTHTVKRGEPLSYIARKYNCTPGQIREWNHLKSSRVYSGLQLVIKTTKKEKVWTTKDEPTHAAVDSKTNGSEQQVATTSKAAEKAADQNIAQPPAPEFIYLTVQPGDTLSKIASRYRGLTVEKLKEVNNISSATKKLRPGMKIKVPVSA